MIDAPFDTDTDVALSPMIDELSQEFVGSWNRLVSQTNWDKGRVIFAWRTKLMQADAPQQAYTDEDWSRRVGNVSPQHVGRLRRVFERFGDTRANYQNLYWSHFQVALDWDDAEMWLEGAVQNRWSVAAMRISRCEALGIPVDKKPIIDAEMDEDVNPRNDSDLHAGAHFGEVGLAAEKTRKGDHDEDDDELGKGKRYREKQDYISDPNSPSTGELLSGLKKIDKLPDDLKDAFEQLKIAILSHKLTEWKEADPKQVASLLDDLKTLIHSEDRQ